MRGSRAVLLPPLVAVLAATASAASCTATTSPSFPAGALSVPPSFTLLEVAGLPASCSGQTFFEGSTSLCPPGLTYFLCDGIAYTEYDCSSPGDGWTQETVSQYDRVATDPAPFSGDGGALAGTVYVENSLAAPDQNEVLVFQYCDGALSPSLAGRYLTGGTGAADLNNAGILDADQQVVVNPSQTLLFAVNQGSDSIAVFHIGAGGLLTPVTGSPFASGGMAPASVGVAGNVLVVANKAVDGLRNLQADAPNLTTFSIAADGSLHPTGSTFPLAARSSPTQAFVAPGGALVFTTQESGVLRGFQLSPAGMLSAAPGVPATLPDSLFTDGRRPKPVWPAGLSASPTQPILYTGIPNNESIAAFGFTAAGELTLLNGEHNGPRAQLPCWSVVSADGKRLYFADAGGDSLSIWDIGTNAAQPALLQTYLLPGGGNPWGLHLDPTGQLLFVIAPRQIHEVPEGQGQLLHALALASDGTINDEVDGSPCPIPVAADTNTVGVAVVAAR